MTRPEQVSDFSRLVQRDSALLGRGGKHAILHSEDERDLPIEITRRLARPGQELTHGQQVLRSRIDRDLMNPKQDDGRAENGTAQNHSATHLDQTTPRRSRVNE